MTVTGERLIASIRAHAAKQPDYVYSRISDAEVTKPGVGGCLYMHCGKPSCIVGHALFDAGLIDKSIEMYAGNNFPFRDVAGLLGLEMDAEEKQWVIDAQNFQDLGYPWSEAVVAADKSALERILAEGI